LKASFPGYPVESTPRRDCFSTEEYLLKEGRIFLVRSLSLEEISLVRRVHQELKRLGGGQVPSGQSRFALSGAWETIYDVNTRELVDVPRPPEDHLDPWTDFAVAQLAWDLADGELNYAEGFILPQEGSSAQPIAAAWNLVNGKVVNARKGPDGAHDGRYFGVVLDRRLRKMTEAHPATLPRILPFVVPGHLYP